LLASWVGGWGSLGFITVALIVVSTIMTARSWRREWAEERRKEETQTRLLPVVVPGKTSELAR
jgi:hypothetical protein